MAGDVHRREDWADHLLAVCGRWWTATRAWTTRDALDGDGLADLRTYLGWARPTAEVKASPSIRVLPIAHLIGEAISRTAAEESVSSLFFD